MNYILEQAVSQSEAGAQVLDVNVARRRGRASVMEQVVKALQSVVSLPLQLDSSHADASSGACGSTTASPLSTR